MLAVSAVLRLNGYPPRIQENRVQQATLSAEKEQTFSESDYLSDFALSGYSPAWTNNIFNRRCESYSRTAQNTNTHTPVFALSAAGESAASHRLNSDISYAEALVVGLPAEDISYPFNTFW